MAGGALFAVVIVPGRTARAVGVVRVRRMVVGKGQGWRKT